jgi:hypothetical protein
LHEEAIIATAESFVQFGPLEGGVRDGNFRCI